MHNKNTHVFWSESILFIIITYTVHQAIENKNILTLYLFSFVPRLLSPVPRGETENKAIISLFPSSTAGDPPAATVCSHLSHYHCSLGSNQTPCWGNLLWRKDYKHTRHPLPKGIAWEVLQSRRTPEGSSLPQRSPSMQCMCGSLYVAVYVELKLR